MDTKAMGDAPASGEERVRKLFRDVLDGHKLPSLPVVANKVLEMIKSPDMSMQKLCRVLADDTALAARAMAVSRSPQYGLRSLPTNLLGAVQVLGIRTLTSIVVAHATQSLCIKGNKTSEKLWNHSLAVAFATRLLSKRARMRDGDLAFLTGLMHDVGQIVFVQSDPIGYEKVVMGELQPTSSIVDKEQEHYGLDHSVMGFTLLGHWNMDPQLAQAVFNHHSDVAADDTNQLAETLALADYLCAQCDLGFFTDPRMPSAEVLARHGWEGEHTTDQVVEQIRREFHEESALFNAN